MDFLPWNKNECDFEPDPVLIPRYSMSDRVKPDLENIDPIDYNLDPGCLFRVKTAKTKNGRSEFVMLRASSKTPR
jgi:hypothetical protein